MRVSAFRQVLGLALFFSVHSLLIPRGLAQDAADADAALTNIRDLVLHARYADASTAVDALLGRTDLDATDRNAALEAQAIILIARRHVPEAREVLATLFSRDPDHRIIDPDAGPDVRDAFDRARAEHVAPIAIGIVDDTVRVLEERTTPTVSVHLEAGADAVHELRLLYRNGAGGEIQETVMRLDATRTSAHARTVLLEWTQAYIVEYFVQAYAPSGALLASLGSEAEPMRIEVPEAPPPDEAEVVFVPGGPGAPGESRSVAEEWWFWTIIGVVVAGGIATGVAVGVTSQPQAEPPGTLGTVRL